MRNKLRFISVVIIVALGISFYIGIKSASPKMSSTANNYFNEYNLLDVRVTSRIPFSDDDINRISGLENVDSVVKSRYVDAIVCVGKSAIVDNNGLEMSCRVSEFNAWKANKFNDIKENDPSYVNRLKLVDGRFPQKDNECVIDSRAAELYDVIEIGTELTLNGDGSSITDSLKTDKLTIVGKVDSPMYISDERGSTQVGSGSLSAFIYVDSKSFSTDDYNELFIKIPNSENFNKFEDTYDTIVTELAENIREISSDVIDVKLAEIKSDYNKKIEDKEREISSFDTSSKKQLEEKTKEITEFKNYVNSEDSILAAEKEKSEKNKVSTKNALNSAQSKFNTLKASYDANVEKFEGSSQKINGYSELKKLYDDLSVKHTNDKKNLDKLESAKNTAKTDLQNAKTEESKAAQAISNAESKISSLNSDISKLKSDISSLENDRTTQKNKVASLDSEISDLQSKIDALTVKLNDGTITTSERINLSSYRATLSSRRAERSDAQQKLDNYSSQIDTKNSSISNKNKEIDSLNNSMSSLKNAQTNAANNVALMQTKYDSAKSAYDSAKTSYDADKATLNKYKSSMDALTSGQTELLTLQKTIESQKAQLDSMKVSLTVAQINYSLAVRNSDVKIQQAQLQLNNAKERYYNIDNEYTELKEEIDQKKANLNGDLKMLKNTLKNVDSITWNTTVQTNLSGHQSFISSMENINSMSTIFPLIFLFTAMVACFVIMLKNVEDERNSIGLFKAFGYSPFMIVGKYISYSSIAWAFGSVIGIIMGTCLFPNAIYSIYGSIYNIPDINIAFNVTYIFRGLIVSFLTTTVASVVATFRELRHYPAVLMRPRAITFNRRAILEFFPAVWLKMSYGMKLLVRTVSRSRKRVVVGTLAIACCTALVLSALGLLNSTSDVKNAQYGKKGVFNYDLQIVLNADQTPDDSVTLDKLKADTNIDASMLISNISFDISATQSRWKGFDTAHIIVPSDIEAVGKYVDFDVKSGSKKLDSDSVVISEKMAEDLDLKVGDTAYFTDNDGNVYSAVVGGIVENYIDHYVYMSPETYKNVFFEEPVYKYILCVLKDYLTDNEVAALSSNYLKTEEVAGVTNADSLADSVDISIEQVLALVIIFVAAACVLAAIVMYTISNVNISERTHEIANIKVIGFSDGEVLLYVIRENIVSTAVGVMMGLIGGIFLHTALVNYISVENVMYGNHIAWWSYIVAIVIIALVAVVAALPILFKISRVNVPETLKAIE